MVYLSVKHRILDLDVVQPRPGPQHACIYNGITGLACIAWVFDKPWYSSDEVTVSSDKYCARWYCCCVLFSPAPQWHRGHEHPRANIITSWLIVSL